MKTCWLWRYKTSLEGTLGVFASPRDGFCAASLECPWLLNLSHVSCVPAGAYDCELVWWKKFSRRVYTLKDVPGRTGIGFHPGNTAGANWVLKADAVEHRPSFSTDLSGCIALGLIHGRVEGQDALLHSGPAFIRFDRAMAGEPFRLVIRWQNGSP
jgi:hypothetical protein